MGGPGMALTIPVAEIIEKGDDPLLGTRASWGRVLLRDIATIQNGYSFESARFTRGAGMPLIRIRDIGAGRTEAHYAGEYDPAYVVEAGDLLVGMDGEFRCALWRGPRGLLNQRVCRVTASPDTYHAKLLAFLLPAYLEAVHRVTSSVTVKHLSSKTLGEIPLPFPPMAQQARIVAALEKQYSRLNDAVAALRRAKANLACYRAAVLKTAVEGRLVKTEAERARREGRDYESGNALLQRIGKTRSGARTGVRKYKDPPPPDISGMHELPQGWIWASYAQMGDVVTGFTPSTRDAENFGGGIPFFRPTDLAGGTHEAKKRAYLSEKGMAKKRPIPAGAVLVTCIGPTIGDSMLAPLDCMVNQQIHAVILNPDLVDPALVHFWTVSPGGYRQILGAASATVVPILNKSRFAALKVPLPPLAEQRRIVAEVKRRLDILRTLETRTDASLIRAERLRRAVLKAVLLGGEAVQRETSSGAQLPPFDALAADAAIGPQ